MKKKRKNKRRDSEPVEGQKGVFPTGGTSGRSPGRGRNKGVTPGKGGDKPSKGWAFAKKKKKPGNPEPPQDKNGWS